MKNLTNSTTLLRFYGVIAAFLFCLFSATAPQAQAAPSECGKWRKRFAFGGLHGHAMVYDSKREATVLFGGYDGTYLNETWEWDGNEWELKASTGPKGRMYHAMAYDSDRGVTVLFGGEGKNDYFKDTWEWDGIKWTDKSGSGPAYTLQNHGMAYDAKNKYVVMFGGYDQTSDRKETWTWNGIQWRWVGSSAPDELKDMAMAYDAKREEVVLFGGYHNAVKNDTWVWDGTSSKWTKITGTAPLSLWDPEMAYDTERQTLVVFGGKDINWENVVLEWDGSSWNLRSLSTAPEPRYMHEMVYDSKRKRMVMVGGSAGSGNWFSDTWEWDGGPSWERILKGDAPDPRLSHAMVYDSNREVTVLVGGGAKLPPNPMPYRDTWEWDGREWSLKSTTGPTARLAHAMAYDSDRGVSVLFGGADDLLVPNAETWEWDGSWTPRGTTATIPPTYTHSMAYDSKRKKTVLFGGAVLGGTSQGSTVEYDGSKWELISPSGPTPSPRVYPAMTYDTNRGVTVMHGGSPNWPNGSGETWEWNGSSWTKRVDIAALMFHSHAMTFDPIRNRTLMYGGVETNTWEWDGSVWNLAFTSGPPTRAWHSMAYDSKRRVAVFFGGNNLVDSFNDTWELELEDADWDGVPDCEDDCPNDGNKTKPGVCGCGTSDKNTDGDSKVDCKESCPSDPNKTSPGVCGCGTPDTDTDKDGKSDCQDECPNDPAKITPGGCGCGVADADANGNGILDCYATEELVNHLTLMKKQLRKLRVPETAKQQKKYRKIKRKLKKLSAEIQTLVAVSGVSIRTDGNINLQKAGTLVKKKVRKALRVALDTFPLNKKKALRAVNKMRKALRP